MKSTKLVEKEEEDDDRGKAPPSVGEVGIRIGPLLGDHQDTETENK